MKFRTVLWRRTRVKLLAFGLFALTSSVWFSGHSHLDSDRVHLMPAPSRTATMIADNDCWTGDAPSDVSMPGHVLISLPVTGVTLRGSAMVDKALDAIFNDGPEVGTVIAFCR